MATEYHEIAVQMVKAKVNAVRRNLNACEHISKFLLDEYNIRAKQLSVLTGEPFKEYVPKRRRKRRKNKKTLK